MRIMIMTLMTLVVSSRVLGDTVDRAETQAINTRGHESHVCPSRHAIGGISLVSAPEFGNDFWCVEVGDLTDVQWVSGSKHQRNYMSHACPRGYVMLGIHEGDGLLLCGKPIADASFGSGILRFETVNSKSTAAHGEITFRACPGLTPTNAAVVTGVNFVDRRTLCTGIRRQGPS